MLFFSLFGWFLALRGLALLAVPQLIASAGVSAVGAIAVARIGFGACVLIGNWFTFVGSIAKPRY
jgi:hypothetical protein